MVSLFDRSSYGGVIRLSLNSSWHALCYDYLGNENLGFRNGGDPYSFEVYSIAAGSPAGGSKSDPVPGNEPAVLEPSPNTFYVARRDTLFRVVPPAGRDTVYLHYYPENVLREFTFLIHGIEGAENIGIARGAISGMSGSYYPYTGSLSQTAGTVMFSRVVPAAEGQSGWQGQPWSSLHSPFSIGGVPLYPEWFPAGWQHPNTGWNKGWLVGAFATFGPVDIEHLLNALTIEVLSHGNSLYWGRWGYWSGLWEETVRDQIAGAIAGGLDWRRQNGGFDIVLSNEGRLAVPPDISGFNPDVNGWDDGLAVPLGW
jgi:hypothetical protein